MSKEDRLEKLQGKTQGLLNGTLKHVRVATLAASLMPVGALMVGAPSDLYASSPIDVPEPASIVLLGVGLAGMIEVKRRSKKQK